MEPSLSPRLPATSPPLGVPAPSLTSAALAAFLRAEVQGRLSLAQLHLLVGAVLETAEKQAAVAWLSLHTASAATPAEDAGPPPPSAAPGWSSARCAGAREVWPLRAAVRGRRGGSRERETCAKSLRWWSLRGVLQVWSAPLNFATRLPALSLHLGLLPPLVLGVCARGSGSCWKELECTVAGAGGGGVRALA